MRVTPHLLPAQNPRLPLDDTIRAGHPEASDILMKPPPYEIPSSGSSTSHETSHVAHIRPTMSQEEAFSRIDRFLATNYLLQVIKRQERSKQVASGQSSHTMAPRSVASKPLSVNMYLSLIQDATDRGTDLAVHHSSVRTPWLKELGHHH